MTEPRPVSTLDHLSVDDLLAISHLCHVCTGYSPVWDGHDINPPCEGAARQALVERARQAHTDEHLEVAYLAGFEAGWQSPECNDPDQRRRYFAKWLPAFMTAGRSRVAYHDYTGASRW